MTLFFFLLKQKKDVRVGFIRDNSLGVGRSFDRIG
jgi:hypothetical protein